MKFDDLWHHINSYFVIFTSAIVAFLSEAIAGTISILLNVPSNGAINLKDYLIKGTVDTMGREEFIIRVVDGKLWIWDLTVTEVLQIFVLLITFIAAITRLYIDVHNFLKNRKKEKGSFFKKKRGE